jgi:polyisoprenoid-binding protein YceI
MKRILFVASVLLFGLTACQNAPKADDAEVAEANKVGMMAAGTSYNVNTSQSTVEWIGTKPIGKHHGTIKIKDGSLTVNTDNITGGRFTLDINSLQPDDQDEKGNTKLRTHLLSDDFFDAEKYPEANFEITNVAAGTPTAGEDLVMKDASHTITGNLRIKGVTKSISFPARVLISDGSVTTDANFNIDRTEWNLNYGNDKSLGDKFIYPEVNLQLHIVANK